jgi:ATP:cob(I)alamin adenosyltransferase
MKRLLKPKHQRLKRIPLRGFVVPGMTQGSAALDIARTIARRAERRVVALSRTDEISPVLLRTLNRLSDFIYMLAREEEAAQGKLTFV